MRYIVIPPKQVLDSVIDSRTKQPVSYGLWDMLQEHCWGHPSWRQGGETTMNALDRIYDAFKDKKEGDVVELENADYEVIKPIAIMEGKQLPSSASMQLNRLMRPFIIAPTEAPKSPGKSDGAEDGEDKPAAAELADDDEATTNEA